MNLNNLAVKYPWGDPQGRGLPMEHIDWSFGAGSKLVLKQINRIKKKEENVLDKRVKCFYSDEICAQIYAK